jgi:hypothetical protein
LPDEALYPIKLMIEEAQLSLASTPDAQIDVHLEQAQQRVREMAQLTDRGAGIPEGVPARLQSRLQAAMQIAAQLDDQHLQPALERIQLRTQDQLREMERLHLNEAAQILTQARELAQLGQSDPQAFRARFGEARPGDAPPQQMTPRVDPSRTPQPSHTPQRTSQPSVTRTLSVTRTAQPQASHTPQPQATPQGQRVDPGPQATSEPGGGPQPQNTPQGSDGPQPQNTPQGSGDPAPQNTPQSGGSDNGSGPGPQLQNTPAPASTPQGPGSPGGLH